MYINILRNPPVSYSHMKAFEESHHGFVGVLHQGDYRFGFF